MKYTDQIGNTIRLAKSAKRIVSLVPSQTEYLHALGLEKEVVGITKFCIHPEAWFRNKKRVGGTKNVDIEKVRALKPDLIIANKEENQKEDIEALQKEFTVWTSDIFHLEDTYEMMRSVGELTNRVAKADEIISKIKNEKATFLPFSGQKVLYFIWKNPYMIVGEQTYIHHLIQEIGLSDVSKSLIDKRYPMVTIEQIKELAPDYLLLSSEPYPFKEKDLKELEELTGIKAIIVDGEYFSWYGSRLMGAFQYFERLKKSININE
jgi:ABC-type Fe3+-hydroxamate transport system substrate-binding protein